MAVEVVLTAAMIFALDATSPWSLFAITSASIAPSSFIYAGAREPAVDNV